MLTSPGVPTAVRPAITLDGVFYIQSRKQSQTKVEIYIEDKIKMASKKQIFCLLEKDRPIRVTKTPLMRSLEETVTFKICFSERTPVRACMSARVGYLWVRVCAHVPVCVCVCVCTRVFVCVCRCVRSLSSSEKKGWYGIQCRRIGIRQQQCRTYRIQCPRIGIRQQQYRTYRIQCHRTGIRQQQYRIQNSM